MQVELFLTLLSTFSALTGLVVQGVKKIAEEKKIMMSYNFLAIIVALIVGIGGTFTYYLLAKIDITYIECAYAVLMGIGSGLCSMVGFDKIKQLIEQLKIY